MTVPWNGYLGWGSDVEAGDLAEMLRSLKERSGLSYGVLAKRLHVSTSTLHRYCSGSAVPAEFAPVERLARLCKATPEELMEVHRRWIVADATRGRKAQAAAAAPEPVAAAAPEPAPEPEPSQAGDPGDPGRSVPPEPVAPSSAPSGEGAAPSWRRRPSRKVVLAVLSAAAAVTVLGSAALAVGLGGSGPFDSGAKRSAGVASPAGAGAPGKPGSSGEPGKGPDGSSPSSPASENDKQKGEEKEKGKGEEGAKEEGSDPAASSSQGGSAPAAPGGKPHGGTAESGVPLTAHVRPYAFEDPCSQRYLIDRAPGDVTPPPPEQDAPAWVSALGGVAAGEQFVEITLQGTGKDTVVLEGLHVRVQGTKAPLPWNSYVMGVGCGGDVSTKSFGVDLDAARPAAAPKAGQRDFPYKVSESDPEVFYVKATAAQHDVKWYLELQWSSGDRRGVLRLDDRGRPFRTSGAGGRPVYQQPLGSSQGWEPAPGA
ncbi:transcriptional regulator [Streptomyces rectiverticillatus]|uniref:transcriptional regulator n=1 Tax=Streptomyces rectiverticillatus TaxID=173860 RepID=UPI0015C2CAA8|nr:helix-turn-helix transcriptional regulator [Streptomyces rectiverticillatus]QLE71814.1 transcriptional regulator [Streptomyces rectiverticillatus]